VSKVVFHKESTILVENAAYVKLHRFDQKFYNQI